MTLEPSLLLREEYQDNIFLTAEDEQEEWITEVTPELHWLIDTTALTADLAYKMVFRFYANESNRDETAIRDVQRFLGRATLFPNRDFSIGIFDEFSRVVIDERLPNSESNPFVNRVNRNLLEVNPRYRQRLGKTVEAGLGYRYSNLYYDSEGGDDSQSHRGDADLAKDFSSRLRLTAGYGFERFTADDSDDYDRQDAKVGFRFQSSSRLTLGGTGGMGWIDFADGDSESSVIGDLWGEYQLTPRLSFRLEYAQDFTNSVDEGLVEDRSAQARLTHAGNRSRNELRVFAREAKYLEVDREDRSAGVAASTAIPLGQRVELGLNGMVTSFRFSDSLASPTDEDVIQAGVGTQLSYRFRIVTLAVGYRYEDRDSEVDANDYRNNLVFAEVRATF
jgi:hypothetical protein